jgi:hypothetical protein
MDGRRVFSFENGRGREREGEGSAVVCRGSRKGEKASVRICICLYTCV